jgi:hypothetical protein
MRIAGQVALKYRDLGVFLDTKQILIRSSKVEARVKVENPQAEKVVPLQYKLLNEVIQNNDIPEEIKEMLEKKEQLPKQWKTKQIYEAIQSNQAHLYKQFCEENNTLTENWPAMWQALIDQTKGTKEDAEKAIKKFLEELRRIRHNALCAKDVVEREDREQWPATTVVKAFLEGKMDKFKAYMEQEEDSADPKWNKRWTAVMKSLEDNREDKNKLQELCSKFMTAQRVKRYRSKK